MPDFLKALRVCDQWGGFAVCNGGFSLSLSHSFVLSKDVLFSECGGYFEGTVSCGLSILVSEGFGCSKRVTGAAYLIDLVSFTDTSAGKYVKCVEVFLPWNEIYVLCYGQILMDTLF